MVFNTSKVHGRPETGADGYVCITSHRRFVILVCCGRVGHLQNLKSPGLKTGREGDVLVFPWGQLVPLQNGRTSLLPIAWLRNYSPK